MALLVLALGMLRVSGSSIGVYATENGASEDSAGVVAGPPRAIRWDEWAVRAPWLLRQLERGLPQRVAGAVGTHDAGVLTDVPTDGWEVLLRPHTAPYRVLDAERAFALEWWTLVAVQLLGVYALIVALTGRIAISASAAALITLSPATQWWTYPPTFTTIGYGSFATALLLCAYRATGRRRRLALSVLAGLALAAFLAALYPPWQIGTALVLVPIGVASVVPDLRQRASRSRALPSLAIVLAVTLGLGGGLFALFVASHGDAIEAISSTVYPGQRRTTEGGGTTLPILFGSAFDYFSSSKPFSLVNGTNQSESSSALPLLLPVAVASLALLARGRVNGPGSAWPLFGSLVGGGVVAAWMLLPVPAGIGRFLLLTRVPGPRLLLPFGFAGAVALALLVSHQRESGNCLSRWEIFPGIALLAAALTWGAKSYSVEGKHVDLRLAGAFGLVVLVGVALSLGRRPLVGLGVLALFTFWQATLINPVQVGLSPLTEGRLRAVVDSLRRDAPEDAGWIGFSVDPTVKGTLTAAGVNNLSGVSPYPDRAAWRILDPQLAAEQMWNRYAHVSFVPGAPGSAPGFALRSLDHLAVTVDPCSPALRTLGARFAVTQGFEIGGCVRPLAKVPYGKSYVMVYRY